VQNLTPGSTGCTQIHPRCPCASHSRISVTFRALGTGSSSTVRDSLHPDDGVTHVLTSYSPSGYPFADNTIQVEESHGMVGSQPQYFNHVPGVLPTLPSTPTLEMATSTDAPPPPPAPSCRPPRSGGCKRQPRGTQNARFHPANVPQHLARGMRKTWGPAASSMNLESVVEELRRDGVDEEVISTVKEIFSAGWSVDALMRKMSKEESRRYVNGETGQVYRALLRRANARFQCCLCHEGAEAMSWKHARDVVRHLRRDHFGLGDSCLSWCVLPTLRPICLYVK
jgi:hypothetical protein